MLEWGLLQLSLYKAKIRNRICKSEQKFLTLINLNAIVNTSGVNTGVLMVTVLLLYNLIE